MNKPKSNNRPAKKLRLPKADSMVRRVIDELLKGRVLDCKRQCKLGTTALHSVISDIRNKALIPVISKRIGLICYYSIEPIEIEKFNNPEQRKIQRNEMLVQRRNKRFDRFIKDCSKYSKQIKAGPKLSVNRLTKLNKLVEEYTAIISENDCGLN